MSSVTKEPRKKPPVPESLGSLVSKVGQTVCCCVTWQRDNWVLPHAWHHEVTSRTWRDFTSFTNSSSSHVSLHSGMLYFSNGPWGEKNSILKPYHYHFSRSQSFAKTHGKKPSTWLSAIFNVCETTFWRKRTDAIWSCLSLTISELCSFSPTGWQARDYFDVRKIPSAAKIFNSVAHFVLRVKTEKTSSRDRSI